MLPLWKKAGKQAFLGPNLMMTVFGWYAMHHICHVQIGRIGGNLSPIFSLLLLLDLAFQPSKTLLAAATARAACMPACRKCAVALRHNALVAAQTTAWSQHCTRMLRKYTRHETSKTFRKFHLKYQVENASQSSWKFAQLELEHQYLLTFPLKIFLIYHEILSGKFFAKCAIFSQNYSTIQILRRHLSK